MIIRTPLTYDPFQKKEIGTGEVSETELSQPERKWETAQLDLKEADQIVMNRLAERTKTGAGEVDGAQSLKPERKWETTLQLDLKEADQIVMNRLAKRTETIDTDDDSQDGGTQDTESIFARDFGFDQEKFLQMFAQDVHKKENLEEDTFDEETLEPLPEGDIAAFKKELSEYRDAYCKLSLYTHPFFHKQGPNCWAFALGITKDPNTGEKFDENPSPGSISGVPYLQREKSYMDPIRAGDVIRAKQGLSEMMSLDCKKLGKELIEVDSCDYQPKEGETLIAAAGSSILEDFHFYKKGECGYWFHKRGVTRPIGYDCSLRQIEDPATCNRGAYEQFLGYYVIRDKEGA